MIRASIAAFSVSVAACAVAAPQSASAQEHAAPAITLPSAQQRNFLSTLRGSGTRGPAPTVSMNVDVDEVPNGSIYKDATRGNKSVRQSIQSSNELLIMLQPNLTGPEILAALKENQLEIVQTLPTIGAVVVDASRRLGAAAVQPTAPTVSAASRAPINRLAETLQADSRFVAVSSNSTISTFSLASAVRPKVAPPSPAAGAERTDWGIADAKFDRIWPLLTAPVTVGVIDVGFAEHEDLRIRPGLPGRVERNDHGNHVAGIMCAMHNNLGVMGALKNCTVAISSGIFLLNGNDAPEGSGVDPTVTLFSEYLGTTLQFIEANPQVRVINLSLGYNWMNNFNIDPRQAGLEAYRNAIRNQGRFFASILAVAKARNVAIVMAAGNDSTNLESALEAEWASPFNQGSALMERVDGWTNGLIVEAHDRLNRRARFSNVKAHLSCPGVDVLSSLASTRTAYGELSGTSMASPYCAAGMAAVLMLRPELPLRDAIGCLRSSPDKTAEGVPKLNVNYSVNVCRRSQVGRP